MNRSLFAVTLALATTSAATTASAQAAGSASDHYVVDYYYKARWGFQQEFIELFRRNHWPLLQARVDKGTIVEVTAAAPRYHATEDGRWDYRVTIVFPTVQAAHLPTSVSEPDRRRLFPDSVRYQKEEHRRFEILEAHWDVPVVSVPPEP